jgi:hypothetical protein
MTQKIQIRRGLKSELAGLTLDIGEFGLTTDTTELYVGSATGNILIAKKSDIPTKTSVVDSNTNGYIVVDGVQLQVYDDAALNNALAGKATIDDTSTTSTIQTWSANKINSSLHTHTNKTTLDKLSDDGTKLLFNGSTIDSKDANAIKGKTVNSPVSGDNGKVLSYNSTSNILEWVTPASGGGTGTVKSVNTLLPDTNGNVTVPIPDTSTFATQAQVQSLSSGSPKGAYSSLSALQTAYPTGDTGIYVVSGNDGTKEVDTLNITGAPSTSNNVTVTLNGVSKNIAVTIGVAEVASLNVTGACTTSGNVTVTLNGTAQTVALDSTTDTTATLVATKIRNTTFSGWTTGGTGTTVTFTANTIGVKSNATYVAGSTGAAGTMTTPTDGLGADTATDVATKIRNTSFTGWTTGGSGTSVTFTAAAAGTQGIPVFSGGTTGTTGAFAVTTQGVAVRTSDWYYWNGTAWTDGGLYQSLGNINDGVVNSTQTWSSSKIQSQISSLTLTNKVTNGNFANGLGSWASNNGTSTATGNVATITGDGTSASPKLSQTSTFDQRTSVGHIVYFSVQMMATDSSVTKLHLSTNNSGTGDLVLADVTTPVANQWYTLSAIVTIDSGFQANFLPFAASAYYANAATSSGKTFQVMNALMVDLTAAYGTGNEPNKVDFEYMLNNQLSGWFDTTINAYPYDRLNKINKQDKAMIKATNLIPNGDFGDGTTNGRISWISIGANFSVSNKSLVATGNGAYAYIGAQVVVPNWTSATDVICIAAKVRVNDATNLVDFKARIFGSGTGVTETLNYIYTPIVSNQEYLIVAVAPFTGLVAGNNSPTISFMADYTSAANSTGKQFTIREVQAFNLTQIFGTGNEPDQEALSVQLKSIPWFDGTGNIFSPLQTVADYNKLQLRPRNGSYVRVNKGGYVELDSSIDPNNPIWSTPQWSFGFVKTEDKVPHQIKGNLEMVEGMLILHTNGVRWDSDYYGEPTNGGHVLNAWNKDLTYRLNLLMGYTYTDEACIQVYSPPGHRGTGSAAAFGTVRIGSDVRTEGSVFAKDYSQIRGLTALGNSITIENTKTPVSATDTGKKGQICYDTNYVYVCVADNTWKRSALTTW